MSKILVTGGAGFIGSHLCEALAKQGHAVTSLDNYFTGTRDNHVEDVDYIFGSTVNITDIFYLEKFDYVYHLGEYSRVEQSFTDIDLVWEYNKLGTYEVLRFVEQSGAKLIYAGSSTKFVDDEDYIQSPYAWSKASNTDLVKQYCGWNNIDYAITYFYNVYGPREIKDGKYATLIAKYLNLSNHGLELEVVLPGTQLRNFTHVNDIISALIMVGEKGHGDEYGIGSPQSYSVNEVTEMFESDVAYLPERKGNRMAAPLLTDKTLALGWHAKYNLREYVTQNRK
jgi:UDP-glucose 4-epimerase